MLARAARSLMSDCCALDGWMIKRTVNAINCRHFSPNMRREPIPADAKPQVVLIASGKHKQGVLNDLTSIVVERGASITGAKRNQVAGVFTAMLSVYIPPCSSISPDEFKSYFEAQAGVDSRLQGFNISVLPLDKTTETGSAAPPPDAKLQAYKLRVEGPQMPGMLNSLTTVLLEDNCIVRALDADVITSGGRPMFLAKGDIDVPPAVAADEVLEKLSAWAVDYHAMVSLYPIPRKVVAQGKRKVDL